MGIFGLQAITLGRQDTFQKKRYDVIFKNRRGAIPPLLESRGLLARDFMNPSFANSINLVYS